MKPRSSQSARKQSPPGNGSAQSPLPALPRRFLPPPWQRELGLALLSGALAAALVYQSRTRPAPEPPTPPATAAQSPPLRGDSLPGPRDDGEDDERLPTGPWGSLRARQLWLAPPLHTIKPEDCSSALQAWTLPGAQLPQVQQLLDEAKLAPEAAQALLATATCDAKGCALMPTAAQRDALSMDARSVIFQELARFRENPLQLYSFRFRPNLVDPWLAAVELPTGLKDRMRRLLYRQGEALAFADQDTVCTQLPKEERPIIVRALATAPAQVLTLHVGPGENIGPLVDFWGANDRADLVRPILQGLARRPAGGTVDVTHLLPPFPAAHLYHYPAVKDPNYSCHHGALNFFADPPDPRFLKDEVVGKALDSEYEHVTGPPRLGDLLTLQRPDGMVLHSMSFIAADHVFTKNGLSHNAPWILARRSDVHALYQGQEVVEHHYRPRARAAAPVPQPGR